MLDLSAGPKHDCGRSDAMAQKTLKRSERLDPQPAAVEQRKFKAIRALERLAVLRKGLPPVDAVEVVRSVRDEAEGHETR